jgi:hypothetical protein
MAIKRFYAEKDNTITNSYKPNLTTRATGSNMGASDILEVFSIYAQATTSSSELSRVLIQFNTSSIASSRSSSEIPASGSVNFYLRMFNCAHQEPIPENFKLVVAPISSSWDEGVGLDMNDYGDADTSNWIKRTSAENWTLQGGDFLTGSNDSFTEQTFLTGLEDLEVDVTDQVEKWMLDTTGNYGFGVFLTSSLESDTFSYYTKKFFGRGSQFFFKRPILEARWEDSKKDNRGNFIISSSMLSSDDNLNKLYLYNVYRGQYKNIQGLSEDKLIVSLYRDSLTDDSPTSFTASKVETGVYNASVYLNTTASVIYDVWSTGSNEGVNDGARSTQFYTGSFTPTSHTALDENPIDSYVVNITNLKKTYETSEKARFKVYARNMNWNPTIYTVASTNIQASQIENLYYRVSREADNLIIVDFSTGSLKYSLTSYDQNGNYFDLDMSLLEAGYSYILSFLVEENGNRKQIKNTFRFRVEESNE